MFYEVYIDIFFAVNVMLDFFIIQLVRKIQRYKSTTMRIVMAAVTGSAILCIFICLPVRKYILVRVLFYIVAFVGMAAIAFPLNRKKGILKATLTLYGVSIFVNGIYQWLSLKIDHLFQLLISGIMIYLLINVVCFIYKQNRENNRHIYNVHIIFKEQDIFLKGLWDTGNRLRSPYHGKGVSVINYESIRDFISEDTKQCIESGKCMDGFTLPADEKIFLIPYQTVGCAHAMMPVLMAGNMIIEKDGEKLEYSSPLLGISKVPVSKGDLFQVILTTDGA